MAAAWLWTPATIERALTRLVPQIRPLDPDKSKLKYESSELSDIDDVSRSNFHWIRETSVPRLLWTWRPFDLPRGWHWAIGR